MAVPHKATHRRTACERARHARSELQSEAQACPTRIPRVGLRSSAAVLHGIVSEVALGSHGALHRARSRIGYAHTDSLLTYPHARGSPAAHTRHHDDTPAFIGTPAGQLLNCTPEPERPYRATRSPTRSTTRWAFGGIHNPTMKQPPSMLIFPQQQAEKLPQNQHVLSFNPNPR